MFVFAISGSVLGILAGLGLGVLIGYIHMLLYGAIKDSPQEFASFLGMGCGAVIGAILGGITANKKPIINL